MFCENTHINFGGVKPLANTHTQFSSTVITHMSGLDSAARECWRRITVKSSWLKEQKPPVYAAKQRVVSTDRKLLLTPQRAFGYVKTADYVGRLACELAGCVFPADLPVVVAYGIQRSHWMELLHGTLPMLMVFNWLRQRMSAEAASVLLFQALAAHSAATPADACAGRVMELLSLMVYAGVPLKSALFDADGPIVLAFGNADAQTVCLSLCLHASLLPTAGTRIGWRLPADVTPLRICTIDDDAAWLGLWQLYCGPEARTALLQSVCELRHWKRTAVVLDAGGADMVDVARAVLAQHASLEVRELYVYWDKKTHQGCAGSERSVSSNVVAFTATVGCVADGGV